MIMRLLANEYFEEQELYAWLTSGKARVYAAYNEDNRMIGNLFVCIYDSYVYISSVCIDDLYRGKGVGKQLIYHAINAFPKYKVWTKINTANTVSMHVFRTLGFVQCSQKFTPYPLSKDFDSGYYPFVLDSLLNYNIYQETCMLQDRIRDICLKSSYKCHLHIIKRL